MTLQEAAAELDVTVAHVRQLLLEGKLRGTCVWIGAGTRRWLSVVGTSVRKYRRAQ
jgi:hypothetical protein